MSLECVISGQLFCFLLCCICDLHEQLSLHWVRMRWAWAMLSADSHRGRPILSFSPG